MAEIGASDGIAAAIALHGRSLPQGNHPYTNKGTAEHALLRLFRSQLLPPPGDYKGALSSLADILVVTVW